MSYHGLRQESMDFEYDLNPYDSFMRNHLKHYGYYTGRNENYRNSNKALKAWDRRSGFDLSDGESDTEYENQALKDVDKNDADNRAEDTKRTTQIVFSYNAGKMVPKLREPRNLYALSKEPGPQQAPRWPADIEVLPDKVSHVEDVPQEPEAFYQPSGFEKTPMPLPEGEGRVVYSHPVTTEEYFLRSRVGGNRNGPIPRVPKLKSSEDTTLLFESRFESGNLMKAIQVSEFEYELQLRYDLYTNKHTQWFYFRFSNTRRNVRYRFTITNFMKSGSLYNSGMRPLMYSTINAQTKGVGWRRVGEDIKYYKNDVKLKNVKKRRKDLKGDRNYYYSLTWTFTASHDNDTCYFAHCYPYTYSDLQDYLQTLSSDPVRNKYCKQRILCRSLAGNVVYILTITSPSINPEDAKVKKAVVVTARVHPGETNASWMMKGFLDYLTSEMPDAKLLRDLFVFKIVPMLNPDGVIVGNYRCSLAGRDLNRNYKTILKDSFPSVTHTKAMIKKLTEEREVVVYCDLHGHSRKQNVFIYGCNNKNPELRLKERIFPIILYNNADEKFNYNNCKFKVQKSKEGTGRVVVWQMGIMNSYTMEASFCGTTAGDKRLTHFTTADFEAMGYHFCDSLLDYCDPDDTKCNQILADLEEKLRQEILAHLERTGTPLPTDGFIDLSSADFSSDVESSTTGSDSSADDGLPVHLIALAPKLNKKKKLKTRKERDKKRMDGEEGGKEKEKKDKSGSASSQRHGDQCKSEGDKKMVAKDKKDKEKLRYRHGDRTSLHSAGRGRQTPCRVEGVPPFTSERNEAKNLKKTEYLEALTNAYLMSGILKPATEEAAPLRYSTGSHGVQLGHVEGLCPHHEKALAEQFVANQLSGLSFADDKYNWSHTAVDGRRAMESATYHSAPARERRVPAKSSDSSHLITTSAPHAHPMRPRSGQQQGARPIGLRYLSSPSRTTVSPIDGVMEAPGDGRKNSGDFVKRGVSSESMSLRTNGCSPSYSVHDTSKSLDGAKQPLKMKGSHGNGSAASPDRLPSRGNQKPGNAMTPAGYQEMMQRKGNRSEVSSQGFPVHLSIVTGTTQSAPSHLGDGADHSTAAIDTGEEERPGPSSESIPPVKKAEASSLAGQILTDQEKAQDVSSIHWPKTATQPKSHNCSTEATPITDTSIYSKQSATPSSHHFKHAQDFYGTAPSPAPVGSPHLNHQEERHPSPVSMGSAARLQAKYGRRLGATSATSKATAVQDGESTMGYRGTLLPASRKRDINPNDNNNNSVCTTPEDNTSNEFPSTTSDDVGDEGFVPEAMSSDSRSDHMPVGDVRNTQGHLVPEDTMDIDKAVSSLYSASSIYSQSYATNDIKHNTKLVHSESRQTKRIDVKAEIKHSSSRSSGVEDPGTSSPDEHLVSGSRDQSHDPTVGATSGGQLRMRTVKATSTSGSLSEPHQYHLQHKPQLTPRSKPESNGAMQRSPRLLESNGATQRSPRLLDRSAIHRSVDGSIHVKSSIPRERVKGGIASAEDLHDLRRNSSQGEALDLDMLISVEDSPYRVSFDTGIDPSGSDTSPHPSARMNSSTVKPMSVSSGVFISQSPRLKSSDAKLGMQRPRSSKLRESVSPRQPTAPQESNPNQMLEGPSDPQNSLQYFSVSKLALQNRAMEKTPQSTPRSPVQPISAAQRSFDLQLQHSARERSSNPHHSSRERSPNVPLSARDRSSDRLQSSNGSGSGVLRPPARGAGAIKQTANGRRSAKGRRSSPTGETKATNRQQPASTGPEQASIVVHQGGFMGHRTQPSYLKVQYTRKK